MMKTLEEYIDSLKNPVVIQIVDGVAECLQAPNNIDLLIVDYDILDGGYCPCCGSPLTTYIKDGQLDSAECLCCNIDWTDEI